MSEEWEATPKLRWKRRVPTAEDLKEHNSRYGWLPRGYMLEQRWRRNNQAQTDWEHEWRPLQVESHAEEPALWMPACHYPNPEKPKQISAWQQRQIDISNGLG